MTSFLEGPLKKAIAAGFRGNLTKGTIYVEEFDSLDDYGDPQSSGSASYPFEGTRDNFDAYYAQQANIPQTDVKIMIILGLTPANISPDPTLAQRYKINIKGQWYQVRRVMNIDPAGATATVQAYQINDPTITP